MIEARIVLRFKCLKCGSHREVGAVTFLDGDATDTDRLIESTKRAQTTAYAHQSGCPGCTKKNDREEEPQITSKPDPF